MAQVNAALIRQQVIDRCLRSPRRYSLKDLMEKCNIALEINGEPTISSKNTLLKDMERIERDFPDASIERHKSGRFIYYQYEDKSFSIYNTPLNDDEMGQLAQTLTILSKFEGMPNFKWIDDLIARFKTSLNIPDASHPIISFEDNPYLIGREYFAPLFNAIALEQTLNIDYQPFGKKIQRITIHPYFLKQYNKRWNLIGCVDGYRTVSVFPLDRIKGIEPSNVEYIPNTEYDFLEYFDSVIGTSNATDAVEKVVLRVSPSTYDYIATKPLHGSQKIIEKSEHSVTISIEVAMNFELLQTILSFGDNITVLSPNHLRDRVIAVAKKILQNYQSVHVE